MIAPLPVAQHWLAVVARLPPAWQAAASEVKLAEHATAISARVWRVQLGAGWALALKLAAEGAPLETEAQALRWLAAHRCPVPSVLAVSPEQPLAWITLEWCGDRTLDDEAETASPNRLASLGRRLAATIPLLEQGFAPLTAQTQSDRQSWEARVAALRTQSATWLEATPEALAWLFGRPLRAPAVRTVRAALEHAIDADPDIGSLDYNARNVVVVERGLVIVDFAAVGVDWPERRFVQYGTATGSGAELAGDDEPPPDANAPESRGHRSTGETATDHAPAGNFATVIGPASARHYAELTARWRQAEVRERLWLVDAHDLLLLCMAAGQLQLIATGQAVRQRARAWANVDARRERLRRLLTRRVAPDGPAAAARRALRTR
ncbi:MAG: hypothetical protein HY332_14405 [Chloroflexi bacterium]|nr:hypothetical protein [Chloroflexota bacterium]